MGLSIARKAAFANLAKLRKLPMTIKQIVGAEIDLEANRAFAPGPHAEAEGRCCVGTKAGSESEALMIVAAGLGFGAVVGLGNRSIGFLRRGIFR